MSKNYCILAGGCFWCIAYPYYELDGVSEVLSGYIGDTQDTAIYEKVKSQTTLHREAIKIVYDDSILTYQKILDIYFSNIDPFDEGGQFIDRGNSYTLALYYHNQEQIEEITTYVQTIENKLNKKVCIEILEETEFFSAEEYHQNYALKNPGEFEKELFLSGRKKKKTNKTP